MSFRQLDANQLDYGGGYDLVYARFLLTHLSDPLSTLQGMVNAAKQGGVIVVEDLDHAAIFTFRAVTKRSLAPFSLIAYLRRAHT